MMKVCEWLDILWRFGVFICQYGFSKCMRTAVCGLLIMVPLLAWHRRRRGKSGGSGDLGFYSWFLLFPAAFMGMSKLFFQRWSISLEYGFSILGHTWVSGVCFAVTLSLAGWWLVRKRMLSRRIRKLYCWHSYKGISHRGTEDWRDCVMQVTGRDRWKLARRYLGRVQVYIGEDGISPFCGGIFRPYIVMQDLYLEPAGEENCAGRERVRQENRRPAEREERSAHRNTPCYEGWRLTEQGKVLLCHELLHLKSGHVLWINLFALLRIYWWFNPLVYLCERRLQQDMEKACDEGCLYYTDASEREYGRMLLNMAAMQEPMRPVGAATFLKDRDYHALKSRIGNLRGKCGRERYWSMHRAFGWGCAAVLALSVLAVGATSYPRYTRMKELSLYDENLHLICMDSPELRAAVQVVDGYLRIDAERMDACLAQLDITGEYVYLGYDTIMKVPGAGGCGNVGMIALEDYEDIFYLRAETWENDLMEFCLKYIL